eukprot:3913593-Pyramimonas_sp.AAC.1
MIAALQFDETDEPRPPGGFPGGPGGDGDPDGDGGGGPNGRDDSPWRPPRANQIDMNWRSFGNNKDLNLLDIPSVQTLRELKQHCMRAVAGLWRDARAAQTWVTEATGPNVPKETLETPGHRCALT